MEEERKDQQEEGYKEVKEATCPECSAQGAFLGRYPHGTLADYIFECKCGCSWAFITEARKVKRKQVVYSTDGYSITDLEAYRKSVAN